MRPAVPRGLIPLCLCDFSATLPCKSKIWLMVRLDDRTRSWPTADHRSSRGFAMHRALIGTLAAMALASVSSAALAADMAPPEPAPSWTGIYLGAGGGFQWADLNVDSSGCRLLYDGGSSYCDPYHSYSQEVDDNDSSAVGVVQGGYDLQIGQYFVTGSYVSWTFGDNLGSDHKQY